ncbi:MAG TPA: hypothetical protein VKS79_16815 [Gemmataceae bacterium]|nr:hypothetical protein [Gemmataceae bacterium]
MRLPHEAAGKVVRCVNCQVAILLPTLPHKEPDYSSNGQTTALGPVQAIPRAQD